MWIKNGFVYQVRDRAWIERMAAEPDLTRGAFADCLPTQPVSLGLTEPAPGLDRLQYTTNDLIVWHFQRQERLLPTSVVRETLAARVADHQDRHGERIGRNERQRLQDEIRLELLPRAFTRNQSHRVLLHRPSGWLIVEAGSEARADELTGALRERLGDLPVVPLSALCQPEPVWTSWLLDSSAPTGLQMLDEFVLAHPDEDATIRLRRVPGDSTEVSQLLDAGYRPSQVHLDWQEAFSGLVDHKSQLKRLRFADALQEEVDQETGDDSRLAEWMATQHLVAATLAAFLDAYREATGVDSAPASQPTA